MGLEVPVLLWKEAWKDRRRKASSGFGQSSGQLEAAAETNPATTETAADLALVGGAPEGGDADITPESTKEKDLNLILEDDMITGKSELDLSKGRKSLSEIEEKLTTLLND